MGYFTSKKVSLKLSKQEERIIYFSFMLWYGAILADFYYYVPCFWLRERP